MTFKKFLVASSLTALCGLGGWIGTVYAIRQWPVSTPADARALDKAAMEILAGKCADCHDRARAEPVTMRIPIIGAELKRHRTNGERHFDPFDRSFLGAEASAEAKAAQGVPQGLLVKLEKVIADDSMPLKSYRLAHWGTGLSESEKELLSTYVRTARAAFLASFGIGSGAENAIQPLPKAIPHKAALVDLGRRLYNDKRLSADNTIACATCHDLKRGATDNQPVSTGVNGKKGGVNAPTAFNAAFNLRQFWDGRAGTLADQAGGPPLNPVEMASRDWNEICAKLNADKPLQADFLKAFPEGFTGPSICTAIGEYEKTLLTPDAPFDRFLNGEAEAIGDLEKAGYWAFKRHHCASCHAGPTLGGQSFEYVNLKADYFAGREPTEGDKGLMAFSKDPRDFGRFKVPTLRNVALTAPYFHDARQKTLPDAVRAMFTYCVGADPNEAEVVALVAFLKSLTGIATADPLPDSQWKGKRVAFLGDSVTDPRQPNRIFWQFLEDRLGIVPLVYAVSGYQWHQMLAMAEKLKAEQKDDVDAIVIFAGTNDFNGDVPPGDWWKVAEEAVNRDGKTVSVKRRTFLSTMDTVRGRINTVMAFLKANFPDAEIILATPLHRGYATFGATNVQPDETYANQLGFWIDDYAEIIREASRLYSVPLVDLFAEAQLFPREKAHDKLMRFNGGKDHLHPNTEGHRRLAEVFARRLLTLPAGYR